MDLAGPILTDSQGRRHDYLRISVVDRCDLRCCYCAPRQETQRQRATPTLSNLEIVRLANIFATLGVNKIRVTGGEPMVRPSILSLLESLARIPGIETLGLTTNGVRVSERIREVARAGVALMNISLDTLQRERFRKIAGRDRFEAALVAIYRSLESGFRSVKVNCVIMRDVNDDEITSFVALTKELELEVRFIEYMPFSGNGWDTALLVSAEEMKARIREQFNIERVGHESGPRTATLYRVPGHRGTVGFIHPMSAPFCSGCNRIRLTSDGKLRRCLFDHREMDLGVLLRQGATGEALTDAVRRWIAGKRPRLGGADRPSGLALRGGRSMIQVGG